MNSPRRHLLKVLGLNGMLAAIPGALLTLVPKRLLGAKASDSSVINHIFIHFPEGTSVETANHHLDQWTNCPAYTVVLNEFKNDGRLFSYRVSRAQNPFVIELHMKSATARKEFLQVLEARGIFNEGLRQKLGYKMSETVYTTADGLVSAPRQVRHLT